MLASERERLILKYAVHQFINTGNPIGSRFLSKKLPIEWSAATIRNTMADLEEQGYLNHPYKSAGRIPTDKGYRTYVDNMLEMEKLTEEEKSIITTAIQEIANDISRISDGMDEILYHCSRALAKISNELGIVLSPRFNLCIFDRLDLIQIAEDRVLIELRLKTGFVKTVVMDIRSRLSWSDLLSINQILNERLSGLSVAKIRSTIAERIKETEGRFDHNQRGLVQLLVQAADRLFDFDKINVLNYAGTNNILSKPDFADQGEVLSLIELLEDKSGLVEVLNARDHQDGALVTIGTENHIKIINGCSVVTASYRLGEVTGTVGVIGPKRMPYGKIIPLVQYTATALEQRFNEN